MDKELLFKARLAEEDYDLPGVGTLRIRALSRSEALKVKSAGDLRTQEAQILAWGIVDPLLTVAEVNRWLDAAPAGELQEISARIAVLSGMLEDAPKNAYKSDGDDAGA